MWSLPDINSLNARAASGAESLKRRARSANANANTGNAKPQRSAHI